MDTRQLQTNYQNARKWRQYPLTTAAGTATLQISLPGTAMHLLGLIVTGFTGDAATATITINNMVIAQDVPLSTFARNTSEPIQTEMNLLVTGNDVIQVVVTDTAAQNLRFNFAWR